MSEGINNSIVLMGCKHCGKSTQGKLLAEKLGVNFFDTDEEITKREGKTPSEIITEKGEPAFRDIEASVCADLATKNNVIISTGGGAILRNENVVNLKHNGVVFFIDRELEKIRPTGDRPLSNSEDKLKAVYQYRYPIYKACADFIVENNKDINSVKDEILKIWENK